MSARLLPCRQRFNRFSPTRLDPLIWIPFSLGRCVAQVQSDHIRRDVTEVDRYGAKRQIDVKIVRRSRFRRLTTIVECKRWKEPVSRDRIDTP